jgi:pyruvate/2-oxoacid:ferredoxin oxidoreductase beta subunit
MAYSHCIAHGINMTQMMQQQKLAVKSGYYSLFHEYNWENIKFRKGTKRKMWKFLLLTGKLFTKMGDRMKSFIFFSQSLK